MPAPAMMYVRAELPDPPREQQHDTSLRHGDQEFVDIGRLARER
jgi:hypothetical protein